MMSTTAQILQDPSSLQDQSELDLYTIPISSSWFKWEDIHEKEKEVLKEFFDGTSLTRTPKIYKEYRDFIINKFREDTSTKLTFSDVRKHLVGDISLLFKVFRFLEGNGLINFDINSSVSPPGDVEDEDSVNVECGPPGGIRITGVDSSAVSRSNRVQTVPRSLPTPLASYSDAFQKNYGKDPRPDSVLPCGSCQEICETTRYEYTKGSYTICAKCFENGNCGENKQKDDFNLLDNVENKLQEDGWNDEETLLLLESVLKNGDDWDLVAKDVPTKTKLECVTKLIELPFGDLILGSPSARSAVASSIKEVHEPSSESAKIKNNTIELLQEEQDDNNKVIEEDPPSKRQRIDFLSDADSSLMDQLIRMSTAVGADITSAAANAAIEAICTELSYPRDKFNAGELLTKGNSSLSQLSDHERISEENSTLSRLNNGIPLGLQLRAAIATALGAAAAHAKALAVKEEIEMETLMERLVSTQLKKVQCKLKDFETLELIMEKQCTDLESLKKSMIEERIFVLQNTLCSGQQK